MDQVGTVVEQEGVRMSDLIYQDGKWYKQITTEYAFSIRKDIQLYWMGALSRRMQPDDSPEYFRGTKGYSANTLSSSWWSGWQRYILVDDPSKEEYECET